MEVKKKIFVADDDEVVLTSIKKLLEKSGFEVKAIKDARDIVPNIKSFKPDLLLLDLLMPHLGGFEVCEMLNNDPDTKGTPIIIISALRGYTDIKRAYLAGVIGYITKPYDFDKLLEKINNAISRQEKRIAG